MKILLREFYLNKMIDVISSPDIKVITGVRRAGKSKILSIFKSYLLKDNKNNVIDIDLSDLSNESLKEYHALHNYIESKFVDGKTNFVLLDEIQMCPSFELAINSLHSKEKYNIYITGSNAFLLSSDLATLFTGRVFQIHIYPFSFSEFVEYYKFQDLNLAFDRYLYEGGFAGSYLYNSIENKYDYINKDVFQTIIVKDLTTRYFIKNKIILDNLCNFMVDNISNLTSINKITKFLNSKNVKITNKTIGNYVKYLCDSFIFYKVNRFDINGKNYLSTENKYYLCDHSVKYAILGTKNLDIGRMYENIVAIELLRRGYQIYTGILYNGEVDFVATKKDEQIYIQVCRSIDDEKVFKREIAPFFQIKNAYPKILITRTKEKEYLYDGIKIIDIAHWLFSK